MLASLAVIIALTGCGSHAETIDTGPTCTPYTWYLDEDGDGLGDRNTTPVELCYPDYDTGYTTHVGGDCDDSDPSVTGGEKCPADYVLECGGTATQFAFGTNEYLVIGPSPTDPTDARCVVNSEQVDAQCAAWSAGATPFAPLDVAELTAVREHLSGNPDAVWLAATAVDGAWTWDAGNLDFADLGGFCDGVSDPPDIAPDHLAWIRRQLAADAAVSYCVGTPDQAWGHYLLEVASAIDPDADGLANAADPDPTDFDADDDGVGDGREVDVFGTDPESADPFPLVTPGVPDPEVAFDRDHAFLLCERTVTAP